MLRTVNLLSMFKFRIVSLLTLRQGKINQNVASLDDDPGGKKEKQVTRGASIVND